jgi:hypothetical protein
MQDNPRPLDHSGWFGSGTCQPIDHPTFFDGQLAY